jgi:hypothetical protein
MNNYAALRLVGSALRHLDEAETKLSRLLDLPGVPPDLYQRIDSILVLLIAQDRALNDVEDELTGVRAQETQAVQSRP